MWPIGSDYADAFQNPRVSFRDPELRAATAELRNRTPNVITGSYAAVCRMTDVSSRSWAVRCFLRDIPDQQERYAAIDAALRALASPATVGFEYQPEGILVNGRRFPILKMEWVAGESLIPYVQARLGQSSLRQLADKLEALVKQLSAAGIAHGDLQFGNVILQGDAPRLIDYDGLYVPALAGRGSHERGHANFQHPNRTGTDFGPTTDHFSVWSIAVALHALSHDASLWGRHEGGDDRLLFCKADYADPETSALFAELATAGNPQVRELTRRFRSHLTTGRVEFPAFLSRPAWVDAEQDSQPPQPPTPNTPEPSNTGRASHIATALRYLAEWDVTVDAWKVSQNHLNIALTNARTEGFSNSRNFESAAWAVAYGALSPTPLCLVVGLWWMVLPCVAAILSCRVALAYRCYATDSALDSTGRPVSVIPQCYLQIINTRRDATFARQDFDESAKQFVDEYLRLEACVKVMVETRRDLKYEPVEAR